MTGRVLIIRSQPGAAESERRLRDIGLTPLCEPIFSLEPIPARLPEFDALAFTSLNGVRMFCALSAVRDKPTFCVGKRTADEARAMGFLNVVSADGGASDLFDRIQAELPKDSRILHAGNEESRGDLCGQLSAAGRTCFFRALYKAAPLSRPGPILQRHIDGSDPLDAIMIHSPRAAAILAEFLKRPGPVAPVRIAAISAAAAAPLKDQAQEIACASSPNETSLIDALTNLLTRGPEIS
ncbi:MAG: uroporphyrinogen-III synthase [Alphaproteobacteria bacterium]|nr:uroporphyrinogen-III synthase [Alphaproteobacteria bacterium]